MRMNIAPAVAKYLTPTEYSIHFNCLLYDWASQSEVIIETSTDYNFLDDFIFTKMATVVWFFVNNLLIDEIFR